RRAACRRNRTRRSSIAARAARNRRRDRTCFGSCGLPEWPADHSIAIMAALPATPAMPEPTTTGDSAAPPGADPLAPRPTVPRHTTPTWEMELLISGATVFALMQLPGAVEEVVNVLLPRFEANAGALVLLPATYFKSAVYALIVSFILHLATRGYWVALVGL